MKRFLITLLACVLLLTGCYSQGEPARIAATTLPVYEFTAALCEGTGITVTRLVTEEVSCLHDYSLNVRQVRAAEAAEMIIISGAGLEAFLEDLLLNAEIVDASESIALLRPEEGHHDHGHEEEHHDHSHSHEEDPHIWLSPANALTMAENICEGLCKAYPEQEDTFRANLLSLTDRIQQVRTYGEEALADLACREIITFHDGFAYFAQAFSLTILEAVEEESGSEASAKELIHLIEEVEHHSLPAIFTEKSGSVSAASIIARETGCETYCLDMAMAGSSWFDAMYHNIDTIREALQ